MEIIKESIKYRSLLLALTNRYLVSRYRGSFLGFIWTILNPLLLMLIYTLVFRYFMRFQVDNYSVVLLCGLLPWTLISASIMEGATAISAGGQLITKSLFPAHILVSSRVLSNVVNMAYSFLVLAIFIYLGDFTFTLGYFLELLFLPIVLMLTVLFVYGVSLIVASMNVFFRDIQHLVGNLLNLLFFLAPVVYPISEIPERFLPIYSLNPFANLVVLYHQVLLPGPILLYNVGLAVFYAVLAFIVGSYVYRLKRETFSEYL